MQTKENLTYTLQVELAEAQLNYIIGQTDTLLQTLDQSDLDTDALLELSLPDEQLKSITNQYISQYKASLEMSKKQIELRINLLEKEKVRLTLCYVNVAGYVCIQYYGICGRCQIQ